MRLKVIDYNSLRDFHYAVDEYGNRRRVDLMTDGNLEVEDPYELIGQTVEVEFLTTYLEVATHVALAPVEEE